MRLHPRDLFFQRLDPLFEFIDGKRVEVLLFELVERILLLVGKEVVEIHEPKLTRGDAESISRSVVSSTIPAVMQAVVAPQPDGAEELAVIERPVPRPNKGEVLVRVVAAGVNRPDILQRRGLYPPPPGAPDILGLEIAGDVVEAGAGADHLVGHSVCALVAGGGYAEYCVAPAGTCLPVPESLTVTEAAAMPETLFTVWSNLFERGFAADGDTVLVHGGTSGIGTMAIALGNIFGLTVIATCGSDSKCRRAEELGADSAINYQTQDFVEAVKQLTGGRGVNVVLDWKPNLVVTDLYMPGMSGAELCAWLRKQVQTANIPVVICSSAGDDELQRVALEVGADGYVSKQAGPEALPARLHALMEEIVF